VKGFSNITRFPQLENNLRVVTGRVPNPEALAASCVAWLRPLAARLYFLRRKIATVAVVVGAASLLGHVLFGANGMIVYRQKRAEYEALQKQIEKVQQENNRYTQQIQGLQSDEKAIEKEAREQMGYAKPGEYVYVAPAPAKPAPPVNHSARK
jgi:cell division protein FtsB